MEEKKKDLIPEIGEDQLDDVAGGFYLKMPDRVKKVGWKCSKCWSVWTESELANNNYNCPKCGAFLFPERAPELYLV